VTAERVGHSAHCRATNAGISATHGAQRCVGSPESAGSQASAQLGGCGSEFNPQVRQTRVHSAELRQPLTWAQVGAIIDAAVAQTPDCAPGARDLLATLKILRM
jgi:hypothetical protein